MTTPANATIHKLSETGNTITPSADDIRGRTVKDKNGEGVGKVHDLLIDDQERKVRFLLVEHGGFLGLGHMSFIPVDAITEITEDEVVIGHSRDHVAAAPPYDPELTADVRFHDRIYSHYGHNPFWDDGYVYPANVPAMLAPH